MTTQIEFSGVNKHYGAYHALKDINLSIDKGSFVALVGPSGCGKSTLLRSLAGLEKITGGDISIAGEVVTKLPPRKRDVAMVFQSYALYPHMTVEENLAYSLRVHGVSKAERRKAAAEVAATTGLSDLLHRYPRELSGGQRQRVAMSRAIIRNPKAFLFDEPLSNLDAALRVPMRKEIRALHDRLGATSVYVTHDQIEAMTMADRIVVMKGGVVEQVGRPLELYDRPNNLFVATFIGSPAMNLLKGRPEDGGFVTEGGVALPLPAMAAAGAATYGIRPEHLTLDETGFRAEVVVIEPTGAETQVLARCGGQTLVAVLRERVDLNPGDSIGLKPDLSAVHLFAEDGRRL